MTLCTSITGHLQELFVGIIILCLVGLNYIQLNLDSEEMCACFQCMAESKDDPWFAERYKNLVPKLLSRQNSELSPNTRKWWEVMILHPEFMKYVSEIWLKQKGKYPSTGFIMLMFSLHICDQVNVFGFGASKNGNWYHYFDKRYRHHLNTGHHRGSAEYNITLTLSLKNKIQMYKGW